MRWIAALTLASLPMIASAGGTNTFTLVPSSANAGQPISLRVESSDGCYRQDSFLVNQVGPVINASFTMSDAGMGCLPSQTTPFTVALGNFTPGVYQVNVIQCVNAPVDPCTTVATLPLTIAGADARANVVPTLSESGLIAMSALALVLGGLAMRRMG